MKIAMLTNNYKPFVGGVPISVERQAHELIKLGHEVTVFAPTYGDTKAVDEMAKERIIRYRTQSRKMENGMVYPGIAPVEILNVFREEKFDCIHVHHPMFVGPWGVYLGRKYDIPVIYTYHTRYEDYLHYIRCLRISENSLGVKKRAVRWIQERMIPAYMRWFADQCDMVLTPSAGMQQILRGYGMNARSAVFPTGLADTFFERDPKRCAQIRETYGRGKKHLLVTVSRLEKEKNYGFLLRGIAELKEKYGDDFHVMIIGEGSLKQELKVRAAFLGIQDNVTFLGNIENSEVKDYLRAADLFLFASKSETQGIVLAEAMAAGRPVVAVHAVGVDDIVKDGVNGFLTQEDEEMYADKIFEALKSENIRRMSAQAENTAENYRASRLAIYEEMLYNQCVREKRLQSWRRQRMAYIEGKDERAYEEKETRGERSPMGIR